MGILDAPFRSKKALGARMRPVLPLSGNVPSVPTVSWAASTGYSGEKSVIWSFEQGLYNQNTITRTPLTNLSPWGQSTATTAAFGTPYTLEFWMRGTDLAIRMSLSVGGSVGDYLIFVDGYEVHHGEATYPGSGENGYLKLQFEDDRPKKIRIQLAATWLYYGLYMPATSYAFANPEQKFQAAIIGDSYFQGVYGGGPGEAILSATGISQTLSKLTGWDVHTLAVNGTGLRAEGGFGLNYRAAARMARLALMPELDLLIIVSSANDAIDNFTSAEVLAEAELLLADIAAVRPTTPVVVLGPEAFSSGAAAFDAALRTGYLAMPQVKGYISFHQPHQIVKGLGNAAAPSDSGNATIFIQVDNLHLTRAGALMYAEYIVNHLREIEV